MDRREAVVKVVALLVVYNTVVFLFRKDTPQNDGFATTVAKGVNKSLALKDGGNNKLV